MSILGKYVAEHPGQEPEPLPGQARQMSAETQRAEREQAAAKLKERITAQIKQGTEPQYILYAAIKAIGLMTDDIAWTRANLEALDNIYSDLAQESIIIDNTSIAAQRLQEKQQEANRKMKRRAVQSMNAYNAIVKDLQAILEQLNKLEQEEAPGEAPNE